VSIKIRYKAIKFVLLDDQLYYKTVDGVLLKCLSQEEAKVFMGETHEGVCGVHQYAHKMKWMIKRIVLANYVGRLFKYYKGCEECQKFSNFPKSPASAMNPIMKP